MHAKKTRKAFRTSDVIFLCNFWYGHGCRIEYVFLSILLSFLPPQSKSTGYWTTFGVVPRAVYVLRKNQKPKRGKSGKKLTNKEKFPPDVIILPPIFRECGPFRAPPSPILSVTLYSWLNSGCEKSQQ